MFLESFNGVLRKIQKCFNGWSCKWVSRVFKRCFKRCSMGVLGRVSKVPQGSFKGVLRKIEGYS